MSMIFQFRMLSDENDHFVRDFEVPYDMNLLDFHHFILQSLAYEPCMASFFTADDRWERGREFTVEEMGASETGSAPIAMERVTLGQLIHTNRDRLIYQFDLFGDRAFYLELTEAKKPQAGMSYPRVAFEHAPAPDQYDPTANRDEGSIFDEAMSDFNDFEGEDGCDDE